MGGIIGGYAESFNNGIVAGVLLNLRDRYNKRVALVKMQAYHRAAAIVAILAFSPIKFFRLTCSLIYAGSKSGSKSAVLRVAQE